jgi:two-component system response regulator RegX3
VARIKAHLARYRRLTGTAEKKKRDHAGRHPHQHQTHRVYVDDREVELKNKEYELLQFLMLNVDAVFSREQLYERIWGLDAMGDNATVVVHINRLREKIETGPGESAVHSDRLGRGIPVQGIV